MQKALFLSIVALSPVLCLAAVPQEEKWTELFDGKSLKGWQILSGYARYDVEDGMIVGTAQEFSPNSFLCTQKSYGDFILEFEVKDDPALNSGVQIRSQVYAAETTVLMKQKGKQVKRVFPAGRVYGYQVEIGDMKNGYEFSGGIYDEARKGIWLYDNSKNPEGSKALKVGQWNKYRVECRGPLIKTSINGVPCAELTDATDRRGIIGLQVHAIQGNKALKVCFRNLRIQVLDTAK